jgi:hypothetical protein
LRSSAFQVRSGLLHIKLAGQGSLRAELRQVVGFLLGAKLHLGDGKTVLQQAQVDVLHANLGNQR